MGELEKMLQANETFATGFDQGRLEISPSRGVIVLTCIDARLDPAKMLGLELGDAHVVRNAGGRATADAIRSIAISSWLLGPREVAVIHHSGCGMTLFTNEALRDKIRDEKGVDVGETDFFPFSDVDQSVRDDVERIRVEKSLPEDLAVSGYVYDVATGRIREVVPAG
ncbi:MAG: beta-class carbonic anhydrase [Actinomycetota bacterium]